MYLEIITRNPSLYKIYNGPAWLNCIKLYGNSTGLKLVQSLYFQNEQDGAETSALASVSYPIEADIPDTIYLVINVFYRGPYGPPVPTPSESTHSQSRQVIFLIEPKSK